MSGPASNEAIGNPPFDRGKEHQRWLEQLTQQWEADGTRLLRPMASRDTPTPLDR